MRIAYAILLSGTLVTACSPDAITNPAAASKGLERAAPPATISGTVFGPDGSSICSGLNDGTPLRLRLLPVSGTPVVAYTTFLSCPTHTYSILANADTYAVLVDPPAQAQNAIPFRWLDTLHVDNTGGAQVHDVHVLTGAPLPGGARRDGVPLAQPAGNLVFGDFQGVLATTYSTDANGAWVDGLGRTPMLLQAGQRYLFNCPFPLGVLGSRAVGTQPRNAVLEFPEQISSFDCDYTASRVLRYTHDATRLVVSALPGDIGGLSDSVDLGWGVQFPVPPGSQPAVGDLTLSELYRGGLVVAVSPDRLLTGYSTFGYQLCGGPANDACHDFRPTSRGKVQNLGHGTREITWEMSDATSPEGIGLDVTQQSFDRAGTGDFVWFRYRIRNTSSRQQTIYAGFWGDWDIGDDAFDDVGATALGGQLMYFHNADGSGPYAGSLVVGPAPLAGNLVYTDQQVSAQLQQLDGQFQMASGGISGPATTMTGDQRAFHTIGPITLRRNGEAVVWIGIAAGNTEAELFANAQAALQNRPDEHGH